MRLCSNEESLTSKLMLLYCHYKNGLLQTKQMVYSNFKQKGHFCVKSTHMISVTSQPYNICLIKLKKSAKIKVLQDDFCILTP